jgi:hypothetical protein
MLSPGDLLQPAAKDRQGERTDLKPKAPDVSPDRREREALPAAVPSILWRPPTGSALAKC